MHKNKFWLFSLLVALMFSVVHEFAFAKLDTDHGNIKEYIHELDHPADKGDLCDSHFEFHTSYIIPDNTKSFLELDHKTIFFNNNEGYAFNFFSDITKPPIA